jgi:hypothetical protein
MQEKQNMRTDRGLCIGYAAFTCTGHILDVLVEGPAGCLERWCPPCSLQHGMQEHQARCCASAAAAAAALGDDDGCWYMHC